MGERKKLGEHPHLIPILYAWKEFTADGDEEVKAFVEKLTRTDKGLIMFVAAFLQESYTHAFGDHVAQIVWRFNLESILNFIDFGKIGPRVKTIVQSEAFSDLTEKERRAITKFLEAVDGGGEDW